MTIRLHSLKPYGHNDTLEDYRWWHKRDLKLHQRINWLVDPIAKTRYVVSAGLSRCATSG